MFFLNYCDCCPFLDQGNCGGEEEGRHEVWVPVYQGYPRYLTLRIHHLFVLHEHSGAQTDLHQFVRNIGIYL